MAITYRYKRIERPGNSYVYTPSIPVTLTNGVEAIDTIALLDSGADHCVLPIGLAELLDLDLSATPLETGGIGGSVQSIPTEMTVIVRNSHERYSIRTPVWAIIGGHDEVPPILGREGFFEHFEITFKQIQKKIILKKVDPERREFR